MRIEILQKELQKLINIAQRAVSSRTTIQILEGLLFKAKDNSLSITATDLELSINTKVDCLVREEGTIVINSLMIGNIVRKLPDAPVFIDVIGEKIKIRCENSEFNLFGQDSADYPQLPDQKDGRTIRMDAETLKESIIETVFATSLDETRPALTGVLFNMKKDMIDFVALDGFRISRRTIYTENEFEIKEIIPARAMTELSKILDKGEIHISFVPGHIIIKIDNTVVYSRLLEGKYINYEPLMSEEHVTSLIIDKKEFQSAIERASLLAREDKTNLIRLKIENDNVNITSNSEMGSVNENVSCDMEGDALEIAFNAKYMLDGVKTIKEDHMKVFFNGSLSPSIMHPVEDQGYTYLVLPVRLAN